MREPTGPVSSDIGVGLGVMALAGIVAYGVTAIPASPVYARVGATVFPWIAAAGLGVLGAALVLVGLRGGWSRTLEDRPTDPFNPVAFGLMLAGLVVNAALIDSLGFVFASTAQFVLVCACFGSRAHLRNLAIGLAVTLGSFLLFDRGLGVNIGAGLLEGIL